MKPEAPGTIYILFREDVVMGWREAMTASQALSLSFGHPHNPKYKAVTWDHNKLERQQEAIEEGRIDGRIWEGCPDCMALIESLNARIVALEEERDWLEKCVDNEQNHARKTIQLLTESDHA